MKGMLISALMLSLMFVSCQSNPGANSQVVSSNTLPVNEVTGWTVHVDTTYFEASTGRLVAKGGFVNVASTDIVTPCQMEGLFYSDRSCETKLGAVRIMIGPLMSGEEAQWTLRFSSADKDMSQYPEFIVAGFRVTAKSNKK